MTMKTMYNIRTFHFIMGLYYLSTARYYVNEITNIIDKSYLVRKLNTI